MLAVLGLNATHKDIPDRVKSLFWSIASELYLYRPLHISTVLGGHSAVKDCSLDPGLGPTPRPASEPGSCEEAGSEFLSAMKVAAMDYLQSNTEQHLANPDRNHLTKQVSCQAYGVRIIPSIPSLTQTAKRRNVSNVGMRIPNWLRRDNGFRIT